jgi:hypothetical protein
MVVEPKGAPHYTAAPFGWRYARRDVLDAAARVTPLAAPSASVRVADLLP